MNFTEHAAEHVTLALHLPLRSWLSFALAVGGEPSPELSPREREVLDLLARGLTNAAIAERLV